MPLFGSHKEKADEHAAKEQTEAAKANEKESRRSSMPAFGRNRNNNRDTTPPPTTEKGPARSGSILTRFRENPSRDQDLGKDPSIKAAKDKVTSAEHAEREADKALALARSAVREARQHVKELEAAALEEARRARAKQKEAKSIRKGADRLGRHDNS